MSGNRELCNTSCACGNLGPMTQQHVYCPRCGAPLSTRMEGGRDRIACLTPGCGYMHFGESSIGCGGIVLREGKALLVQRGVNPGKGNWQIPGGYVEVDERIHEAIEREVLEEAGIVAKVSDCLGFRHSSATGPDRPFANIYVVFRLDYISGEPRCDGLESLAAGFYDLEQAEALMGVQSMSLWVFRRALALDKGRGFTQIPDAFQLRPGWSLFGLNGD